MRVSTTPSLPRRGQVHARKSVCGSQASVCAVTDALRRRYDGQADREEGEEEGRVGVEKQVKKRGS